MQYSTQFDPHRRRLLTLATAGTAAGLLAAGSWPLLARADADAYPTAAFDSKKQDEALKDLFGSKPQTSDKITLTAPAIAENGAVVPITVESALPKVTRIAIMVPENPFPLASDFVIPDGTEPYVSSRIKMGKTSSVIALVESDGKLYSTSKLVKVTVGGCGG